MDSSFMGDPSSEDALLKSLLGELDTSGLLALDNPTVQSTPPTEMNRNGMGGMVTPMSAQVGAHHPPQRNRVLGMTLPASQYGTVNMVKLESQRNDVNVSTVSNVGRIATGTHQWKLHQPTQTALMPTADSRMLAEQFHAIFRASMAHSSASAVVQESKVKYAPYDRSGMAMSASAPSLPQGQGWANQQEALSRSRFNATLEMVLGQYYANESLRVAAMKDAGFTEATTPVLRGGILTRVLMIEERAIGLFDLFWNVIRHGGFQECTRRKLWNKLFGVALEQQVSQALKAYYQVVLLPMEKLHSSATKLSGDGTVMSPRKRVAVDTGAKRPVRAGAYPPAAVPSVPGQQAPAQNPTPPSQDDDLVAELLHRPYEPHKEEVVTLAGWPISKLEKIAGIPRHRAVFSNVTAAEISRSVKALVSRGLVETSLALSVLVYATSQRSTQLSHYPDLLDCLAAIVMECSEARETLTDHAGRRKKFDAKRLDEMAGVVRPPCRERQRLDQCCAAMTILCNVSTVPENAAMITNHSLCAAMLQRVVSLCLTVHSEVPIEPILDLRSSLVTILGFVGHLIDLSDWNDGVRDLAYLLTDMIALHPGPNASPNDQAQAMASIALDAFVKLTLSDDQRYHILLHLDQTMLSTIAVLFLQIVSCPSMDQSTLIDLELTVLLVYNLSRALQLDENARPLQAYISSRSTGITNGLFQILLRYASSAATKQALVQLFMRVVDIFRIFTQFRIPSTTRYMSELIETALIRDAFSDGNPDLVAALVDVALRCNN